MNDRVRVDVWLWRARMFKTRTLSARAVEGGCVRLMRGGSGRLIAKPAEAVRPGDVLIVATGQGLRSLEIAALGERRGPPAEARTLYLEPAGDLDAGASSGHSGELSGPPDDAGGQNAE